MKSGSFLKLIKIKLETHLPEEHDNSNQPCLRLKKPALRRMAVRNSNH